MTTANDPAHRRSRVAVGVGRRLSTETKAAYKTTELIVLVVVAVAVLIASAVVDNVDGQGDHFSASQAWWYVTVLAAAYMISRGLAKSGSRQFYDEQYGDDDLHREATRDTDLPNR